MRDYGTQDLALVQGAGSGEELLHRWVGGSSPP